MPVLLRQLLRRTSVRIVLVILAIPLLLAAFVGLALPSLLVWQAPQQLKSLTNHDLTLGKPSINPFLLRMSVPATRLQKPDGEVLIEFDQLKIDLRWAKLLQGVIRVDEFKADRLSLNLAVEQEARLNWQDLLDAFQGNTETPAQPNESTPPPDIELARFELSQGQIHFEDRRTTGGYQTTLTPIDLTLENLSTIAREDGQFEVRAQSEAGASFHLNGALDLAAVQIKGQAKIESFELGSLAAALSPLLPVQPPTGVLNVSLNFDAASSNTGLNLSIDEGTIKLAKLQVRSISEQPAVASLEQLTLKQASYVHTANKLTVQSVEFDGLTLLNPNHQRDQSEAAFKQFAVRDIRVDLLDQNATIAAMELAGPSAQVERRANGDLNLLQTVELFQNPKREPAQEPERSAPQETNKPWTWRIDRIEMTGGQANYTDRTFSPALNYGIEKLAVSTQGVSQNLGQALPVKASLNIRKGGALSVKAKVVPANGEVSADLSVTNLPVAHAQPFLTPVVRLDVVGGGLYVTGQVNVKNNEASFSGNADLNGLRLNNRDTRETFLKWDGLQLVNIEASAKGATIDRVRLAGLDTRLAIAADKTTNLDDLMISSEPAAKAESTQPNSTVADEAFALRVNRFSVANSALEFEDRSLFIPFGTKIQNLEGIVTGISTRPDATGEIELNGQVDDYGLASAEGQLTFMNPTQKLDLNVLFKNLAMENLTPYTATFANRKIDSGKLNLELNYKINEGALDSTNRVIVEQLKLGERVESPDAVDLPLDLAVAILEDADGVIDLGLPVSGSLDDPQFSIGAVALKALQNLLTNLVTAPFRALGALFGGGEELGEVAFGAGKASLSPPEKESVKKLGLALQKRPNLGLTIQGTWAEQDRVALQRQSLRFKVATGLGLKLEPGENPGPIATEEEQTRQVLEDLFEAEFGKGELLSIKEGYKKVNPDKLDENLGAAVLSSVTGVFADKRELSPEELQALKGTEFHKVLRDRLQKAQVIEPATLLELGNTRAELVINTLTEAGVTAERLSQQEATEVELEDQKSVALNLDLSQRQAQISAVETSIEPTQ